MRAQETRSQIPFYYYYVDIISNGFDLVILIEEQG